MLAGDQKLVLAGCFIHSHDTFTITQNQETPLLHLSSDHEEADRRMLLHASDCSRDHQRIVVQSPDTDVAALCVYACNMINTQQLWFRTGVKDKLRFLPVHRLAEKLGEDLCRLIPSFHALTGCDSTSALYQIGKRKAWKALLQTKDVYVDLAGLGDNVPPLQSVAKTAEAFISSLYAIPSRAGTTAYDVRYTHGQIINFM